MSPAVGNNDQNLLSLRAGHAWAVIIQIGYTLVAASAFLLFLLLYKVTYIIMLKKEL